MGERVAVNLSRSWYRRRQAERRARARHGAVLDTHVDPDLADTLAVRTAIAGLPTAQRSVLTLRFCLRLSVAETAAALGCSPGAVKQHSSRAIAALRGRGSHRALPAHRHPKRVPRQERNATMMGEDTDIQLLVERAVPRDVAPVPYESITDRVRQRRRRATAAVCPIVVLLAVWVGLSAATPPDIRLAPTESVPKPSRRPTPHNQTRT